MKLTPLDIRHKEFRRAVRGYSDEEVDVFLDEVADQFERLYQSNMEAQDRLRVLEDQVQQYENLKDTLQKTLVSAQAQADETKSNARKEAELILRDAELKGRDIINEAYGEKQKVQQSLIQLRRVEEDYRFKFRSLLEAHLNLLAEDEVSDERRQFQGLVSGVEADLHESEAATAAPERPSVADADLPPFLSEEPEVPGAGESPGAHTVSPGSAGEANDATAVRSEQPLVQPPVAQQQPVAQHQPAAQQPPVLPGAAEEPEPQIDWGAEDQWMAGGEAVEQPGADETDDSGRRTGARRFLLGRREQDEKAVEFFSQDTSREFEW